MIDRKNYLFNKVFKLAFSLKKGKKIPIYNPCIEAFERIQRRIVINDSSYRSIKSFPTKFTVFL